ncbi:hypothetical protein GKR41_00731 [Candidatus Vallotia lariciata]|nr:hypothetical protein GKR41_00731 [Candidatus Vallotia lariciata]
MSTAIRFIALNYLNNKPLRLKLPIVIIVQYSMFTVLQAVQKYYDQYRRYSMRKSWLESPNSLTARLNILYPLSPA